MSAIRSGTVKWYDSNRAYGFIAIPNEPDALIDAETLFQNRIYDLPTGAAITCEVRESRRGQSRVKRVISVHAHAPLIDDTWKRGTIKWFSRVDGYGFVEFPGDDEDAMLHASTVRRSGLPAIGANMEVLCQCVMRNGRKRVAQVRICIQ